jgi:hypothetical protein
MSNDYQSYPIPVEALRPLLPDLASAKLASPVRALRAKDKFPIPEKFLDALALVLPILGRRFRGSRCIPSFGTCEELRYFRTVRI